MTIVERPYNISFSLNDIRYVFQLDDLTRAGLLLQVKLRAKPLGGDFSDVYTFLLQPANDGKIYLYIQEYINSLLTYVLPAFDQATQFTNADKQACIFTIHFREISDNVTTPDYVTTEETYLHYAIKGGIEKHLHSRNNFFLYFEGSRPFLTWQPTNRFIDKNEQAFLTFLNPNYNNAILDQAFGFCYRLTDINGNVHADSSAFLVTGLLIHIRINVAQWTLGDLDINQLYKLECGVVTTGNPAAYNYTFFFEYRPVYAWYDLVYHNSLGGIDSVRVKGEVAESVDRNLQEGSGGKDVLSLFASTMEQEAMYAGISLQKKYKGDVGYLREKSKQYAFTELLVATGIYMHRAFRWVPVVALQKSQDYGSRRQSLNSFAIEWGLSESNEVYTPAIELGMGNTSLMQIVEQPVPPVPLVVSNILILRDLTTHNDGLIYYIATFDLSGVADRFVIEVAGTFDDGTFTSYDDVTDNDNYHVVFDGTTVTYTMGFDVDAIHQIRITPFKDNVSGTSDEAIYSMPCPVVSGFTLSVSNGFLQYSIDPFPDDLYPGRVVGIGIIIYKNGQDVMGGYTNYQISAFPAITGINAFDGDQFYAIYRTNCNSDYSIERQTDIFTAPPSFRYQLVIYNFQGSVIIYVFKDGTVQQAPFNTLLTVQVQWTDGSGNNHTDFVNATLEAGSNAVNIAMHTEPGESINNVIIMNANPITDGTSTYYW